MKTLKAFVVTMMMLTAGALLFAESARSSDHGRTLNPADLEKAASAPSLEQLVLRTAAEKLRQGRTPSAATEVTVTVVTSTMPGSCGSFCVTQQGRRVCLSVLCPPETK
ncbi:MAG: hypothetical protein JO093_14970 [Acidobacteria bacterium]|nr:hypothetical protein [Acidobacteriota bacterium]MBV9070713.1 hypothetical protein [Acidobacteriota bacterium]MBV9186916.1 hypothetical protein [Acidobacteriota bacterium]